MKMSLTQTILRSFLAPMAEPGLRAGSIKAVKAYIKTVKAARLAFMGLFGIGAFAAVLISGICLVIAGIVGLLPITAQAVAIILLVIGAIMAIGSSVALTMILNQKRWLQASKSYELMEAVIAPWPDSIPPKASVVLSGQGPKVFGKRTHEEHLPVAVSEVRTESVAPLGASGASSVTSGAKTQRDRSKLNQDQFVPLMH
jgi:hypothetical protein